MALNSRASICAGIVTFNPEEQMLRDNLSAIAPQVDAVVVFDNGSDNVACVSETCKSYRNVVLIQGNANFGIAYALNELCLWASANNYDWCLTLDQDSICGENMIEMYMPYADNATIGILCPEVYYEGTTLKQRALSAVDNIEACMTSASLTNVEAWLKVGGFDDWMFIDYVDNDFCLRLRLEGYEIKRVRGAELKHSVGHVRAVELLGKHTVYVFNHSAFRVYYIARNTVYYARKYKGKSPVAHDIALLLYGQFMRILFEDDKLQKMKAFNRGLVDGFRADTSKRTMAHVEVSS